MVFSNTIRFAGRLLLSLCLSWACLGVSAAHAQGVDPALLAVLAKGDTPARLQALAALGQTAGPIAPAVLEAMRDGRLYAADDGHPYIVSKDGQALDPATGQAAQLPEGASRVTINNRLRRALDGALAVSRLQSDDPAVRLSAARRMQQGGVDDRQALDAALAGEKNAQVREALHVALAALQLDSQIPSERAAAAETLGNTGSAAFRARVATLLARDANGQYLEQDESVREAAAKAIRKIDRHMAMIEWAGNAFYGLSLGSVLLLAALGLAITFGLMGVINMAHGELLMIGAYVTYVTQLFFRAYLPDAMAWYVVAALPAAFVTTALVGMALERTVIRWLYGRPLETLLATWGISLMLIQGARSIFGAQNVEVANPGWMSGGVTVLGGLVLSYNRIAIVVFAVLVVLFVWFLLNHTRLGLFVRAITQNRSMADCVGVPTGRIDMLAFGLGSGIAGLGGVALSQLGNVGPDLGRAYLVDSFMVVVLGGVGQLAGTVVAALGLGAVNKLMEPFSGAVIAKITIFVLIVLFIQKRPQGLYALRGRSAE
jgi:urea transport system permease protein